MDLNLRSIGALVQQQIDDAKASSPALAVSNTTQGSVLLAIFRSVAGVGAWFQSTALDVLRASRLTTSSGVDVDSWMNDFGLIRLPASSAEGVLYFSRFAGSLPASVPVGAIVKTGDNSLSFVVIADTSNPRYNTTTAAYEVPADTYGCYVSAQAIAPGTASNVISGAISLSSSGTGFDAVVNKTAFGGGLDAETDDAFRARFQAYIASLAKATLTAIQAAIASTQQGLRFLVQPNTDAAGVFQPGHMTITVDDGSGSPPASLLTAVAARVEAVKAVAETYSVLGPLLVPVNIFLYFETDSTADRSLFIAPIQKAVTAHIATLGVGQPLRYSRIFSVAFSVSSAITNVAGITLNDRPQDLVPSSRGLIVPGIISIG